VGSKTISFNVRSGNGPHFVEMGTKSKSEIVKGRDHFGNSVVNLKIILKPIVNII
jgi:hypothetical protein